MAATAEEFGATPSGFKVMYGNIVKKYRDNNLYIEGEGGDSVAAATGENDEDETAIPAPAAKAKTPRKRKAPAVDADGSPTPRKKGRPSKKEKEEAEAAAKTAGEAANGDSKQKTTEKDAGMGALAGGEVKAEVET